ncbi:uncharacterized protein LOC127534683 [Acanthochromis polyacanthus]|uniref:uncharacterized protein LOC127534683 n=1 Tax=Acanthochromis polyacanthus TaxID=80966 RepID=UPI002234BC2E|nr:uncharacterized protein LOC127534683 [Acanthochromis polyacanthus]
MEVRKPYPKISEVVWPEHTERKSNSKEIFLSTQALCHLTPSPSPMNVAKEEEQTSHTDNPEEEQPVIYNNQDHVSSFEDLSSVSASSFTSASSLPLMKQDRPYVYERTLTLQRISSLLTDGENQSSEDEEEEEEESRTPSSNDALPDSRELLLTPDGATDPTSINSLNKDNSMELMLSPGGGEEDKNRIEENIFTVDEPSMDENHPSDTRLNLHSDNQSVPDFLSPDYEKGASCSCEGVSEGIIHGPPDVNREEQSDWLPLQVFSCSEAATSDSFLEKKINQTAAEHHQQEAPLRCFNQDLPCTPSDTTHDLLTDLHQSFVLKEPKPSGSPQTTEQDRSLPTTMCSSTFLTHLQGVSLTSIPTCSIKTTSAPSDATNDSASKYRIEMDELCVQGSMGNWWQQSTETCTDSRGVLSAAEPGAGISSDNKRPSLVLTQPYNYSLLNFMDFTTKQKGDNSKQEEKEEAAGWSSSMRASQGAIRSGRTRSRKGKRVKRM